MENRLLVSNKNTYYNEKKKVNRKMYKHEEVDKTKKRKERKRDLFIFQEKGDNS